MRIRHRGRSFLAPIPGTNKTVTTETGFKVQVPLFVSAGDKIRVDTRTGTYITRA